MLLKVSNIARQSIGAIEDEILGELALLLIDLSIGGNMGRINNRHIESRFNGMVQENAVQNSPCVRFKSEGDIADTQDGHHSWHLFLNTGECVERFDCCRL